MAHALVPDTASSEPRILIVDDNLEFRAVLGEQLGSMGFSIVDLPVETIGKILDAVTQARVDAIVLDICMPGMNGFDILKAIRDVKPAFPAIILTGSKNSRSMQHALKLGCNTLFEKPCDIKDLVAELHHLIQQSRQGQESKTAADAG